MGIFYGQLGEKKLKVKVKLAEKKINRLKKKLPDQYKQRNSDVSKINVVPPQIDILTGISSMVRVLKMARNVMNNLHVFVLFIGFPG